MNDSPAFRNDDRPSGNPMGNSTNLVIWGLILSYIVAPLIVVFTIPNMYEYSFFSNTQSVSDGATTAFWIAGIIALAGLVSLLLGISRALQTVDRLGEVLLVKETSKVD
jgi:TRAP-type mannitol/chloroaromatic compound transport system permease small subunit